MRHGRVAPAFGELFTLRHGFNAPHALVLVAIIVVATALALVAFDRRDLAA